MIRFEQVSETFGDCTANYSVHLDKPYSVSEFVEMVLTERKGEWGKFEIYKPNVSWLEYESYAYRYGKWEGSPIPEEIMKRKIVNVKAHGGWSAMDYLFTLEETEAESTSTLKEDKLYHFGNISIKTQNNGSGNGTLKIYIDGGSLAIYPNSDNTITIGKKI